MVDQKPGGVLITCLGLEWLSVARLGPSVAVPEIELLEYQNITTSTSYLEDDIMEQWQFRLQFMSSHGVEWQVISIHIATRLHLDYHLSRRLVSEATLPTSPHPRSGVYQKIR